MARVFVRIQLYGRGVDEGMKEDAGEVELDIDRERVRREKRFKNTEAGESER